MRDIDKRTHLDRRAVLRGAAAAAPAAALASVGLGITAEAAWAQAAKALPPPVLATLVKMSRDIFPHDHIGDSFYVAACTPWDDKAAKDAEFKALLVGGVARADADAKDRFSKSYIDVAWEFDRVQILHGIEHTPFFKKVRGDLVVSFYNQEAVWPKFGYEGPSADKGGYIHRGFDDINWLPTA